MSRTKSLFTLISLIVIASLALAACTFPASQPVTQQPGSGSQPPAGEPPTPGSELPPITGLAGVERIEILVLESFPVQIRVAARGNFPDGCTKIDQVTTSFKDNTFLVTLTTTRPAEASCTQALVPFEEVIPLEAVGLPAGLYTVNVNSVIGTFELAVDNILEEPTPAPASGSIEGVVWHDLCAVAGGEGGAPLAAPEKKAAITWPTAASIPASPAWRACRSIWARAPARRPAWPASRPIKTANSASRTWPPGSTASRSMPKTCKIRRS
jgi:hypothetical protein